MKIRTTISIDPDVLKSYQGLCSRKGMKVSTQLELFMKKKIGDDKNGKE